MYFERFFAECPCPDDFNEDGHYVGDDFYAVVNVRKYSKDGDEIGNFWHVLLTEAQLEKLKDAKALTVSKRTAEMKAVGSDDLLHVFGPGRSAKVNTEWPFVAALMRWFHDKVGVSYHKMALGEAGTCMPAVAGLYSMFHPEGKAVATEAAIEGRSGDFYGGWGFYFARKYLADSLEPGRDDDPMKGYEESVEGTYIPPGRDFTA